MNKQQLQTAADTVEAIGQHMEMPDVGGHLFTVMASKDAGCLHILTTDSTTEEMVDMLSDALCLDIDAFEIIAESMRMALDKKLAAANAGDQKDPRSAEYWSNLLDGEEDADLNLDAMPTDLAARQEIFNQFDDQEQAIFWTIEDALNTLQGEGRLQGSVCQVRDIMDVMTFPVSKPKVMKCLKVAKCEIISRPGRTTLCDTAPSIFRITL